MNPLPDESKKRLTKFLEEEWQPIIASSSEGRWIDPNRSFTTGNDMLNLKEKIAEKGEWDEFEDFALRTKNTPVVSMISLPQWLFTMPRFAELVDEFMKEARKDATI